MNLIFSGKDYWVDNNPRNYLHFWHGITGKYFALKLQKGRYMFYFEVGSLIQSEFEWSNDVLIIVR